MHRNSYLLKYSGLVCTMSKRLASAAFVATNIASLTLYIDGLASTYSLSNLSALNISNQKFQCKLLNVFKVKLTRSQNHFIVQRIVDFFYIL